MTDLLVKDLQEQVANIAIEARYKLNEVTDETTLEREAKGRQRQIAQIIRYVAWSLTMAISLGSLAQLQFFTEVLRALK